MACSSKAIDGPRFRAATQCLRHYPPVMFIEGKLLLPGFPCPLERLRTPSACSLRAESLACPSVFQCGLKPRQRMWGRTVRVRIPLPPPASLNCREIPPPFTPKYAKHARNSRLFAHKPDCRERTARQQRGTIPPFLWRAHAQSGFERSIRRMQCDHEPAIPTWWVDFCRHLENRVRRFR